MGYATTLAVIRFESEDRAENCFEVHHNIAHGYSYFGRRHRARCGTDVLAKLHTDLLVSGTSRHEAAHRF